MSFAENLGKGSNPGESEFERRRQILRLLAMSAYLDRTLPFFVKRDPRQKEDSLVFTVSGNLRLGKLTEKDLLEALNAVNDLRFDTQEWGNYQEAQKASEGYSALAIGYSNGSSEVHLFLSSQARENGLKEIQKKIAGKPVMTQDITPN